MKLKPATTVSEYYDNYLETHIESGINARILSLFKRIKAIGVNKSSTVFEIGAGIGALTFLLSTIINRGKIEATDLSPKSIDYLKKKLPQPNIVAYSGDILNIDPKGDRFDFILLFDVLEHIPLSDHPKLFRRLSKWMHPESRLLINIPNPDYIVFEQNFHPELLQVIDQPVTLGKLALDLQAGGLDIIFLETYSIWVKNDYRFFIVQLQQPFEEVFIKKNKTFLHKLISRMKRKWRTFIWPYSNT